MIKKINIRVTNSLLSRKFPIYLKIIDKNYMKRYFLIFSENKILKIEIKKDEKCISYLNENERNFLFNTDKKEIIIYDEFKNAASLFISELNKHLTNFQNIELLLLASSMFTSMFFYKKDNLFFSINYEQIKISTEHNQFDIIEGKYNSRKLENTKDDISIYLNAFSEASDKYYEILSVTEEHQNRFEWILDDWQLIFDYGFLYPSQLDKDYYNVIKKVRNKDIEKRNRKTCNR